MGACLAVWIKDTLTRNESDNKNFLVENLSYISTSFGLLMLFSIFQDAGDLGIVLLFGSLISILSIFKKKIKFNLIFFISQIYSTQI